MVVKKKFFHFCLGVYDNAGVRVGQAKPLR